MTKLHRKTTDERCYAAEVAESSLGHDGLRYHYNGYRYDKREDAVAYASLVRDRPGQVDGGGSFAPGKRSLPRSLKGLS